MSGRWGQQEAEHDCRAAHLDRSDRLRIPREVAYPKGEGRAGKKYRDDPSAALDRFHGPKATAIGMSKATNEPTSKPPSLVSPKRRFRMTWAGPYAMTVGGGLRFATTRSVIVGPYCWFSPAFRKRPPAAPLYIRPDESRRNMGGREERCGRALASASRLDLGCGCTAELEARLAGTKARWCIFLPALTQRHRIERGGATRMASA